MKDGDLFKWRYKTVPNTGSPYWCCSRISEFVNGRLRDTYWFGYERTSDGHTWTAEEAEAKLDMTFIANRADLVRSGPQAFERYERSDIIDLRHPNNSSGDNVWLRRGAEESTEVKRRYLKSRIADAESSIRCAQGTIEWCERDIAELDKEGSTP